MAALWKRETGLNRAPGYMNGPVALDPQHEYILIKKAEGLGFLKTKVKRPALLYIKAVNICSE